ncbi:MULTISPECIES: sugar-binding protein [Paenibacillus]|uniref:sugar-binding protein n=1 Tax=Paenibacillus TaxID=44249 RepID=UPI0022B8EB96|nr:sugar-binding protein [Paenibacillus caseinilyticus]MCZ8522271.1 agarase [Paenibacillus caseinilyticus]
MNVRRWLSGGCVGALLFTAAGTAAGAGAAAGQSAIGTEQLEAVTNGVGSGFATAVQVDRFGQWVSASFPEKVTDEGQLQADMEADAAYYGSLQAPDWDSYGGLKGSREQYGLVAKGFYSIQEAAGRKVMATPEGNVFFSLGVNGIAPTDTYTVVTGREGIYEWIPPYESQYKSAFLTSKDNFSYYLANRIRKTGQPYTSRSLYTEGMERVRKWGFNTAAGWTPVNLSQEAGVPHVPFLPLGEMAWAKVNGLKFFDIFVEGAEAKLEAAFEPLLTKNKDNPYIIGYFLGNESYYHKLASDLPKLKGSEVASKRRLVGMLRDKYGDIASFNTAWNGSYGSFEELNDAPLYIDSQQAQYDVDDFVKLYLDTFYGTVARVFHKYDTNHLLLGDRWLTLPTNNAKVRGFMAEAAGRYMDVISINHYAKNLDKVMLAHVYQASGGRPIMLTENGYGTNEQGLGAPLLVADQNERQLRYRTYVEGAASLGYIVGAHWFAYLDQAATGRWAEGTTGERYNFGLLNVADRPYKRFLEGVMATNKDIYPVVLGGREPFKHEFGDAPRQPGSSRLEIPYTEAPIPIDGQLNGFPAETAKVTLGPAQLVNGTGGEGMRGEYYWAWDEGHLYVTAVIQDPTPMKNNNPNINVWKGDGVELFVGPQDLTTPGDPLFLDRQLIASAGLNNGQPFGYWFNTNRQRPVEMAVQLLPEGGGYVLEAALAWDSINLQGQNGERFLFDFGFDDSEDGNSRKRQWAWNGTSANSTNRGHWGQATLVKRTAPVIAVSGVEEGGDYTDEALPEVRVDDASGVKSRTVTLDGAPWTDGTPVITPGRHELTVEAENTAGVKAAKTVSFAVYGSTTLELSPVSGQYSDEARLEAKLMDRSGQPVGEAEVRFEVGGEPAGTAATDAQGRSALSYRIGSGVPASGGPLPVKAVYTPAEGRYLRPSAGEGGLAVQPEAAAVQYTGDTYVKGAGPVRLSAQVKQQDDGSPGPLEGLPVRFTVYEVRPDGTLQELSGVTDSVYATGPDGRAAAEAALPPGLYEVRAELSAGPFYAAPEPARSTVAVAAPVKGHSAAVNGTLPGGTFLGRPAGLLLVTGLAAYDAKGGVAGALRVAGEPGGAELSVTAFDWLVTAGDRAYLQGTAVRGGQTYTVRLLLQERNRVSLYVWKGRDTSAEPLYRQLNVQLRGSVLTLP